MKKIMYLLFLSSINLIAQGNLIKVSYTHTTPHAQLASVLYSDNRNSLYIIDFKNSIENSSEFDEETNSVSINKNEISESLFYKSLLKNEVYNQINTTDTIYTKDIHPALNWELSDETKKIHNFNCQKATLNFRGRKYIAWYTPEIPIFSGPWKFKGLPGLILEVSNDNSEKRHFSWKVEEIQFPYKEKVDLMFKLPNDQLRSLETYEKEHIEKLNDFERKLKSNLPKGVTITSMNLTIVQLETEFEWDTKEKTKK
ncbi:GLPGLI family protein [Aureivirga sp. CE67]|uniref:GLPGLI family protein n=1 Tax=Aureivirga sp. CE67 TaxID=1788983 RepID=UPI0018C8FECE|nr:GLPGLI family protein [Aureivirga sp. CE67]